MRLAIELKKAGLRWSIDPVVVPTQSKRDPDVVHQIARIRIQIVEETTDPTSGVPKTVVYEETMSPENTELKIERALSFVMRRKMPTHPVFRSWLKSKGNIPTKISDNNLGENLGECIHTALRKLVDSPESAIQWNAVHHLMPKDWSQLLEQVRVNVRELQAEVTAGTHKYLSRYEVGEAIKKAFTDDADNVVYREDPKTKRPVVRTELQKFALMSLLSACKVTELQDYIWGWAGYLCEDLDEKALEPEAGAVAAITPSV